MGEDRSKQNNDFVMYFRPFMDEITKMAGENYTAYKVFQLICKHMDGTNALAVSNNALSEILDMSTRTIQRAIKYLRENGWVDVLKSGTSNVYIINPDVAWTSYADQKQYCKFRANVLLSSTENAEYLNNPKATTHFKTVDQAFMRSIQARQEEFEDRCNDIKNDSDQLPGQVELKDVI